MNKYDSIVLINLDNTELNASVPFLEVLVIPWQVAILYNVI